MPAPKPEAKPDPPRQPAAAVSAERALRALQRPLAVVASTDPEPPGLDGWREWLAEPPPRGAARVSVALLFEAPGVTIVIRAEVDA